MIEFIEKIFDAQNYMPHGYCLLWQPELVWMHILGDITITLAYFSIPLTIAFLLYKRKQTIPFRWIFVMFAAFIFLCGTTHLISIITLWYPIYYFDGIIKVLTAAISLATAFLLFPLIPHLLDIFSDLTEEKKDK